jgi:hypothetical protein
MRAIAVAGRYRMDDRRVLLIVHAPEGGERRVRGEEAVERQRGAVAGRCEGEIAVQRRIVRIADRRDRREAVDRAAQDHYNEPRISRARRARRRAEETGAAEDARAERPAALTSARREIASSDRLPIIVTSAGIPAP